MRKLFDRFSLFELMILALLAAVGVAVKPLTVAVSHIVTGPLSIPGGALSGGLYMLFVILGGALVNKPWAATMVCAIQCLMVMTTGIYGTHGAASVITYMTPGLLADLLWLIWGTGGYGSLQCFFGCVAANVAGSLAVNLVFFRLPPLILLFSIILAAFSGGIGGIIAWNIAKTLKQEKALG